MRTIPTIVWGSLLLVASVAISEGMRETPVEAATITVTRTDDPTPDGCPPNDCSLREAVLAANASPGADTIVLPSGTYSLTTLGTNEDGSATGDLDISDAASLTLQGAGAESTIVSGGQIDRVFDIVEANGAGQPLTTISGVTIRNGKVTGDGGGVRTVDSRLKLVDSVVDENQATNGEGGGVFAGGQTEIVRTTIESNQTNRDGGGIVLYQGTITESQISGNSAGRGGGVFVWNDSRIVRSVITNNVASSGGGLWIDGDLEISDSTFSANQADEGGGGIYIDDSAVYISRTTVSRNRSSYGGGISGEGNANVVNSTISGNEARDDGGGIGYCGCFFNNVTITSNVADSDSNGTGNGGGLAQVGGDDQWLLVNSIVAGNSDRGGESPDCVFLNSGGHNLIQIQTGCTISGETASNITGVDPLLGPLTNNGGLTDTHSLGVGSPAIDAASPATFGQPTACESSDQVGTARPQRDACDMGSLEILDPAYDGDADGHPNISDNCPLVANPLQGDNDADGAGDECDTDDDNDSLLDTFELERGCLNPLVADAGLDQDSDQLTTAVERSIGTHPCVSDTDGDSLPDGSEQTLHHTNPMLSDTEGDGMPDGFEVANPCLAPLAYDSTADSDGDGLTNFAEFLLGTNPCVYPTASATSTSTPTATATAPAITPTPTAISPDTDGDGVPDGIDNCPSAENEDQLNTDAMLWYSVHPVSPPVANPPPADRTRPVSDVLGDACDSDDDNDGLADSVEELGVPSPPGPCASATVALDTKNNDTDGDGATDSAECTLGTNPANGSLRPTMAACAAHLGVTITADTDGDGIRDAVEFCGYGSSRTATDTDFDGCEDGLEITSVDINTTVNSNDLLVVAVQFSWTDRLVQDIDKNGIVNSADLLLVALNFGKAC